MSRGKLTRVPLDATRARCWLALCRCFAGPPANPQWPDTLGNDTDKPPTTVAHLTVSFSLHLINLQLTTSSSASHLHSNYLRKAFSASYDISLIHTPNRVNPSSSPQTQPPTCPRPSPPPRLPSTRPRRTCGSLSRTASTTSLVSSSLPYAVEVSLRLPNILTMSRSFPIRAPRW